MSRVVINEERCKGCLLCTSVCPSQALVQSDRLNAQGYKPVEACLNPTEPCSGCGFCAEICPDLAITVYRSTKSKEREGAA